VDDRLHQPARGLGIVDRDGERRAVRKRELPLVEEPDEIAPWRTVEGIELRSVVVAAYKGLNAGGGPKGVGDAVNQSVVITFMLLFVVNFVATAVYFQVVPGKI